MASEIKVDTVSEKTSGSGVTIDGLLIKDGGISGDVSLIGTTPTFTIGDAGAEDAALVFDGNAQDFYIALDDSADDLVIGKGSAVGTTPAVSIDENLQVIVHDNLSLLSDSSVLKFGTDGDTTLTHTDGTGLTLNSTNKICFNDATQFVQGSSGTVLSIGATDEIDLTATAVDLNGTLDVSGTSLLTGRVGVVTAGDLGTGIHVRTADSGAGVSTNADELVVENSGTCGISILSGNSQNGVIHFGDDGDNDIGNIDYDHSDNSMKFVTNAAERMRIDSAGHVTMPLQPAFNVNSATMNNLAINTTHTVQFNSERFDNNADFNTSNYTFTAPVTGRYQLQFQINIEGMDEATSYYRFKINTSNEDYNTMLVDPSLYDSDGTWHLVTYCILADMDANDVSTVAITVTNDGTAQADVSNRSVFSGFLVC